MIQNGYFLPLTFVRDICWKLGILVNKLGIRVFFLFLFSQ